MIFQKAYSNDFERIKSFYWDLIDEIQDQNDVIGWKKGIYPTDEFLQESLLRGELFTLEEDGQLYACTVLNSESNEGYAGIPWSLSCRGADPSRIGCSACTAGQGRRTAYGGRNPAIRKSKWQKGGAAGHSRTERRRGKAVHKMRHSVRAGQNDVLRGHRLD